MKTQLAKQTRIRARYTDEYTQQALELWRASGRGAAQVAAELGIPKDADTLEKARFISPNE